MACWTNFEIRKLVEMHRDSKPPLRELAAAFPRHTFAAVKSAAFDQDLRHRIGRCERHANSRYVKWLEIAHRHFSKIDGSAA